MSHDRPDPCYLAQLEVRDDGRTLEGIAVPYGTEARIGRYVEVFARGAFADAGTHPLTATHPRTGADLPIGVSVELCDQADGLHGAWYVSDIELGNEVLTLVRDGVPLGLSVGFVEGRNRWNRDRTRVERGERHPRPRRRRAHACLRRRRHPRRAHRHRGPGLSPGTRCVGGGAAAHRSPPPGGAMTARVCLGCGTRYPAGQHACPCCDSHAGEDVEDEAPQPPPKKPTPPPAQAARRQPRPPAHHQEVNLPRRCIDCGRITHNPMRCTTCARSNSRITWARRGKGQRYRSGGWEQQSKQLRAQHLATHGPVCPGWARPPHRCSPQALVVDHDAGVMCRSCNAVKAATVDKKRNARARRDAFSDSSSPQHPRLARKPVTHRGDEPPGAVA